MLEYLRKFFQKDAGLKAIALILALIFWFYVVNELNKGTEEERQFLSRMLSAESLVAKKLSIRPVFVGKPKRGYYIESSKVVIVPEYCIVVGGKDLLGKIKFAYTMPIDMSTVSKTFIKSVPLNPIAPGVFMEETLVQVTVPVEKMKE